MSYIVSPFCTALDQRAVVALLKQLSVLQPESPDVIKIIKAVWDRMLKPDAKDLLHAVSNFGDGNVLSFSLSTLALGDQQHKDPEILRTMLHVLDWSLERTQRLTLRTYSGVLQRINLERGPGNLNPGLMAERIRLFHDKTKDHHEWPRPASPDQRE